MLKLLLPAILFVLLTLVACSDPATTAVVAPTLTSQPEATQPADPTQEPTQTPTTPPTEIPPKVPKPTTTEAPAPTSEPEPTATATPTTPRATAPATTAPTQPTPTWHGLTVAAEDRCSPYNPDDYPYPPSVEPRIVEDLGGVYGPYTGTWFESIKDTDIEHIVARSEAHDSGLCAADSGTRSEFASDLLNLTLASPSVNRHQKVAKDVAEWLPDLNECWYVNRTIQVRQEYELTIDYAEADAIDRVLAGCDSTEMVVMAPGASTPAAAATPTPDPDVDALALWDDNGNGRITCSEARAHGIAPVRRGHPAYQYMNDADGDGVVCE